MAYHFYNAWHNIIQEHEPFVMNAESQEKQILQEIVTQITKYKDNVDKSTQARNDV